MKTARLKARLFYLAHFMQLIFLFLAILMLVVHLGQKHQYLSFEIASYRFYYLLPSYLGIFTGLYKAKLNRVIDRLHFEKEAFGKDHGTISMEFPKKQMFIMGSFALVMELFLAFKGFFPERNLLIVGVSSIVLYFLCRIIMRIIYMSVVSRLTEL